MTVLSALGGRPALISGAGSGIGEGLARHAALQAEMKVAIADIDADRAEQVAADLRLAGAETMAVPMDVTNSESVATGTARVVEEWGPIALLGCNAGVEFTGPLWEMTPAQWEGLQAVNVNGAFNLIHAAVPAMLEDGRPAHVLCVSSIGGISVAPLQTAYLVSKHAMRVMGQCLVEELTAAGSDIGVSILLPGAVRTRIFENAESTKTSVGDAHRLEMAEMLATQGLSPGEVAAITFDAINRGDLWIHTHPEISRTLITTHTHALGAGIV